MRSELFVIFAVLAAATACAPATSSDVANVKPECTFRTAQLDRGYCRVSVYDLVANAPRYFGFHVYTIAYLEKGPGESLGLAPSPHVFESNDTISCIEVVDVRLASSSLGDPLSKDGVYVVQIAGELSAPSRGLCSAKIQKAVIASARYLEMAG